MVRDQGAFKLHNPWPRIGWGTAAAIIVISFVLGFPVLGRYRPNDPPLDLWSAICRGLGITSDTRPAAESRPALRTPTQIAWTSSTLDQIAAGDTQHGGFIGMNCSACYGQGGVSPSSLIPTIAGMDAAAIYKQLDDYRSGKRLWGVMGAMAKALSAQDSADVAAYFAAQPGGLPTLSGNRIPESGRSLRQADPARRLVFAGDPQRGIPPCSACHGPGGYRIGAPALTKQNELYLDQQLHAFAQGTRGNDMNLPMRTIAAMLTESEMHALAQAYADARQP